MDSLPPWGHALATGACGEGNGGGGALVTGANEGARSDGNSGEGPALATDAHPNDNKNSNVQGDPA